MRRKELPSKGTMNWVRRQMNPELGLQVYLA
jgi:hypothetical protein